jgi:hypothetical protein
MANTFTLISSYTATGSVSSIDFTSIPSTYSDLCVKVSFRASAATVYNSIKFTFNGSSSGYSYRYLEGSGSSASSGNSASAVEMFGGSGGGNGATASTFASGEIYIPNYAGSTNKSLSIDEVGENNATAAYMDMVAGLWSNTAAINRITFNADGNNFLQYTNIYIYGVKNA